MSRTAQGNRIEAGAGEVAGPACRGDGQDHSERAGPEGFRRFAREGSEYGFAFGYGLRGDMGNQRVEARAPLGLIEACHRFRIGRITGQPVDGLGRHGDEPARPQHICGTGQHLWRRGYDLRGHARGHSIAMRAAEPICALPDL